MKTENQKDRRVYVTEMKRRIMYTSTIYYDKQVLRVSNDLQISFKLEKTHIKIYYTFTFNEALNLITADFCLLLILRKQQFFQQYIQHILVCLRIQLRSSMYTGSVIRP